MSSHSAPSQAPAIKPYIGRFAPSPTGGLHFGSLVSALACYLDAKSHHGIWLVRIEDLDPPREEKDAASNILRALETHNLYWDQSVLFQSQRQQAYTEALEKLDKYLYPCHCSRRRIAGLGGCYDGYCRRVSAPQNEPTAVRIAIDALSSKERQQSENFSDLFLGQQYIPLKATGDFIVRRKDRLFAYQLAVAVDDQFQGVTHVIRGQDLLDSTSRQRYLLKLLGCSLPHSLPHYGHTPLALGLDGHKLSKQTRAKVLDNRLASKNLWAALQFLRHAPPRDLARASPRELLRWAIGHWQRQRVSHHNAVAPAVVDE